MSNQNRQLYIVISQTGTLLSRILKQITGAEYNHASISLPRDLERMYSFGRRHPYNPFWEKSNLTLKEAAAYSGIGINKLREITNEDKCKFVLWVGNKRLIKRRLFDCFVEQAYSI